MGKKFSEMSSDELDKQLAEVERLLDDMKNQGKNVSVNIDELTDFGLDCVFSKIYDFPAGSASNWMIIGPIIDREHVKLDYLTDTWDAGLPDGPDFISAQTPCLAVAKLMASKFLIDHADDGFYFEVLLGRLKDVIKESISLNSSIQIAKASGLTGIERVKIFVSADNF